MQPDEQVGERSPTREHKLPGWTTTYRAQSFITGSLFALRARTVLMQCVSNRPNL